MDLSGYSGCDRFPWTTFTTLETSHRFWRMSSSITDVIGKQWGLERLCRISKQRGLTAFDRRQQGTQRGPEHRQSKESRVLGRVKLNFVHPSATLSARPAVWQKLTQLISSYNYQLALSGPVRHKTSSTIRRVHVPLTLDKPQSRRWFSCSSLAYLHCMNQWRFSAKAVSWGWMPATKSLSFRLAPHSRQRLLSCCTFERRAEQLWLLAVVAGNKSRQLIITINNNT